MNNFGLDIVKELEQCRLTAYLDVRGVATIGWGHTGTDFKMGDTWTQDCADQTLATEFARFQGQVQSHINTAGFHLNDNQLGALTSFAYNEGLGNVITLVHGRLQLPYPDPHSVPNSMLLYDWAGKQQYLGLLVRRHVEADLYRLPFGDTGFNAKQLHNDYLVKLKGAMN